MKKLVLSLVFIVSCTGNTPCVASHPLFELELYDGVVVSPYDVCDAREWRIPEAWQVAHETRKKNLNQK
jgi:activator of HSP90 ATPase